MEETQGLGGKRTSKDQVQVNRKNKGRLCECNSSRGLVFCREQLKTGLICGTIYLGEQVKKEALFMAVDHTQYKDRLFNFLFGSEENKAWTLSLYNAVNGSNYM